MQVQDRRQSVRLLIESTGIPFTAAHYEPHETLFFQGDEDDSVMYVESGLVELAAVATNGSTAICGLLGADAFLGEEALTGCSARSGTATAMAPTDVLILQRSQMAHLLATDHEFGGRFIEHSVTRIARLEADLANQLLYPAEARLARVLMALAKPDGRDPKRYELPQVTQEFIARMVGTTRPRVNRFLGKFKEIGFVEDAGGVLCLNPARFCLVAEGSNAA